MADDHATSISNTPDDPTPYIRTYAKDVARLTHTQAVSPHSVVKKDAPTPGVAFSDVDLSQSQGSRSEEGSAKQFKQEILSITNEDTVANLNAPAEVSENKRDEILTRLRSKIQAPPVAAPVVPPPTPIAPPPPPAPPRPEPPALAFPQRPVPDTSTPMVSAPSFGAPVEAFPFRARPVPETIPAPPQAIPEPEPHAPPAHAFPFFSHHAPKSSPGDPVPSNLHTFKSDFADHIDSQKASTFSVLAAQSDSRDTPSNTPRQAVISSKKSKLPLILSSVVMILVGIAALGGAYWFVVLRLPAAGTPFTVPSLIFADEKVELPSDASSFAQAIANVAAQPSVHGNVIITYITTTSDGKQGIIKTAQPGGALIKKVLDGAPDILLRNISDASTAGVINDGTDNAPFFILQVTSYERTFAGMLGWEPTIASDLSVLYPTPAATAGTSIASQPTSAPSFIDSTVANHDVRILKSSDGQTILLYGYRDKETLIIAKDEAAFTAILARMNSATGS